MLKVGFYCSNIRDKGYMKWLKKIKGDTLAKMAIAELKKRKGLILDLKNLKLDLIIENKSVYRIDVRNLDNDIDTNNDWQIPLVSFRDIRFGLSPLFISNESVRLFKSGVAHCFDSLNSVCSSPDRILRAIP